MADVSSCKLELKQVIKMKSNKVKKSKVQICKSN